MGNLVGSCLNHDNEHSKTIRKTTTKRPLPNHSSPANSSTRFSRSRSSRRNSGSSSSDIKMDDAVLREHAMAAAAMILQQHRDGGGSLLFDRSASVRHPMRSSSRNSSAGTKNQMNVPRSASTRPRDSTDLLLQPHQLVVNQDNNGLENVETNHFVLVHGGGFGAWCWYKTIALLDEAGFRVTAIDLTGSGIHSFDPNRIKSLSEYVKPLTDFLEKLAEGEKVILVGHDMGGSCISHAMELYSPKISKAIFVAAAMLNSGQSTLDMFSMQTAEADELMKQGKIFLYGNGNEHPPTAIDLDKSLIKELLFNQSPQKDIALASVSMRAIPFAPVLEQLSLTDEKYGSVNRYYIETTDDNAIPIELQEKMVKESQPKQVFRLKGSDHSPFFSKPQALHKLLVEISKISSSS